MANIKKSTFIGIMMDLLIEPPLNTKHANIYVHYISEGEIKEDFLGTFALESATAQGYFKALTAFVDSLQVDALHAFLQNLKTVVRHFKQASTKGSIDSAKVNGILKDLKQSL